MPRLLIINPGSTSTKFGVYQGGKALFTQSIRHGSELANLPDLASQRPVRETMIYQALAQKGIDIGDMEAIVGRGGLLHPLKGGVYEVNDDMVQDLESGRYGWHASNLGGIIAAAIAESHGLPAYIADPVIVDEMEDLARYSGWPGIERRSVFHALNQKAVARRYASEAGQAYQDLRLIVAHLGGGISVGAHKGGQVIDVNDALSGDGPFSAERT
ncbi:MAG TPA: butyrate kinase, partial [Clostridia bacterium]|nr:butyrate kinase [Clostridia bacterium]